MKAPIIPFLCCGLIAVGLSSCNKEVEELSSQDDEIYEKLETRRKELNELVKTVDELETQDQSEKLIDLELKIDSVVRQVEFEKAEQISLGEEGKDYEKKLADYRGKYPLKGN